MQDKLMLDKALLKEAANAGIQSKDRAATYFLTDHDDAYTQIGSMFKGKLEIMDTRVALKRYKWLADYYWKAVSADKDEFTKKVAKDLGGGYFIRILKGQKVNVPIQSCLMIKENKLVQRIHNIIIAEEGSVANIISGCVQSHGVSLAQHIGVSEFYVKKGAKLNFTMIHNWSSKTVVRPRSASIIDDDAAFTSNYICLTPVKDIQMYPVGLCNGKNSIGRFTSLLYAHQNSLIDVGGKVDLIGKGSKAEIISRVIAMDTSTVFSRGMLIGTNPESKGHLECSGLLLGKGARIIAVPELVANAFGSELSHEAAVGKIAEKELLYLMSRGLTKEEATSVIIRGFLDTKIFGLPIHLQTYIDSLMGQLEGASG